MISTFRLSQHQLCFSVICVQCVFVLANLSLGDRQSLGGNIPKACICSWRYPECSQWLSHCAQYSLRSLFCPHVVNIRSASYSYSARCFALIRLSVLSVRHGRKPHSVLYYRQSSDFCTSTEVRMSIIDCLYNQSVTSIEFSILIST